MSDPTFTQTVNVTFWDASHYFGRTEVEMQSAVAGVAQQIARAAATGGVAVVLPGPDAGRAVLITADGQAFVSPDVKEVRVSRR